MLENRPSGRFFYVWSPMLNSMVWLRRIGSLKVSVVLLGVLFFVVLGGTLAQAAWGTGAVQTTLFSRVLFEAGGLWWPGLPFFLALTGVNLAAGAWTHLERSVRHAGLWLVHGTLALFCFASLGFGLTQDDLVLGLVPGAETNQAFVRNSVSDEVRTLPFRLRVETFRIDFYPNSSEPSDYISTVTVRPDRGTTYPAEIRMNQPLRVGDWAVFQSSVQRIDGQTAPVYKLLRNPWAPFPYVFSALLGLGLLVHLVVGRRVRP